MSALGQKRTFTPTSAAGAKYLLQRFFRNDGFDTPLSVRLKAACSALLAGGRRLVASFTLSDSGFGGVFDIQLSMNNHIAYHLLKRSGHTR
jgi:hypothetical protein